MYREQIMKEWERTLVESQEDIPPEFSEMVDKHFWELTVELKTSELPKWKPNAIIGKH